MNPELQDTITSRKSLDDINPVPVEHVNDDYDAMMVKAANIKMHQPLGIL